MTELRMNSQGILEIWTDKESFPGIMRKKGGGSWDWEVALKRALKVESPVYYYKKAYNK